MAPTTPGSNRALEDLDDQVSDPPAPALAPRPSEDNRDGKFIPPK